MYYTVILLSNLHFHTGVAEPAFFIEFDVLLIAI